MIGEHFVEEYYKATGYYLSQLVTPMTYMYVYLQNTKCNEETIDRYSLPIMAKLKYDMVIDSPGAQIHVGSVSADTVTWPFLNQRHKLYSLHFRKVKTVQEG